MQDSSPRGCEPQHDTGSLKEEKEEKKVSKLNGPSRREQNLESPNLLLGSVGLPSRELRVSRVRGRVLHCLTCSPGPGERGPASAMQKQGELTIDDGHDRHELPSREGVPHTQSLLPLPETKQIFPDLQLRRVRFDGNPFNLICPGGVTEEREGSEADLHTYSSIQGRDDGNMFHGRG